MIVSQIVAMENKGGIGKDNQIPWHLATDLKRFKQLTMGHHLIMGRKTYETIGRPLIGRTMIVLTRDENYHLNDCIIAHSIAEAINIAKEHNETEVFIIGGGDVFFETIDITDQIYLTQVFADIDVDTFFPPIDNEVWKTTMSEGPYRGEKDDYAMCFKVLSRKAKQRD